MLETKNQRSSLTISGIIIIICYGENCKGMAVRFFFFFLLCFRICFVFLFLFFSFLFAGYRSKFSNFSVELLIVSGHLYAFIQIEQGVTQGQFLSRAKLAWIQSFLSPGMLAYQGRKNPVFYLPIGSRRDQIKWWLSERYLHEVKYKQPHPG